MLHEMERILEKKILTAFKGMLSNPLNGNLYYLFSFSHFPFTSFNIIKRNKTSHLIECIEKTNGIKRHFVLILI